MCITGISEAGFHLDYVMAYELNLRRSQICIWFVRLGQAMYARPSIVALQVKYICRDMVAACRRVLCAWG